MSGKGSSPRWSRLPGGRVDKSTYLRNYEAIDWEEENRCPKCGNPLAWKALSTGEVEYFCDDPKCADKEK